MSPLPVINDVFQAKFIWTSALAPRQATNTLYFRDTVGGQDEINLNTDINANVSANMWLFPVNNAAVTSLALTDLSGSSAGVVFPQAAAAKWTATGGSDPILQGSMVVSVKTRQRGKHGRGRIYLPWVAELVQTAGVLLPANVATCQTAWTGFFTGMVAAGWQPCVVSLDEATYVDAINYICKPYMQTQRRRALR
jgi:hypothetical protein